MNWVLLQIKEQSFLSPSEQPPYALYQPPPPTSSGFNLNKVSPSILLIIIILAIIFFISGLLHLLVRFLLRPPTRDPDDLDNVTALQGQLQQLFHLHDAGVDQSFIDTLPIFNYKAIIGVKDPFDCAVCLCEFEPDDNLRLLPKCSHAFHMECIDTWLLSHSTCPLCRSHLLPDFNSSNHGCSPIVLVLESGSETSREIVPERENSTSNVLGTNNSMARVNSNLGFHCRDDSGSSRTEISCKSCEIQAKDDANQQPKEERIVVVKLGKFKNVDGEGEGSSEINGDSRRCFSMGSFAYVMDENSELQVPIRTPIKKQQSKKPSLPLTPGHRQAMSECDYGSRREFNGFEPFPSVDTNGIGGSCRVGNSGGAIGRSKRESFSVSEIWLRGKKEKPDVVAAIETPARRAFSFRFVGAAGDQPKGNKINGGKGTRRTISEIDLRRWEEHRGGVSSELGWNEENQSFNSLDSQTSNPPSFARRTLHWLVGRQNKVVHSSFSNNV